MAANSAGNGPDTVINTTCRSHCGGVCPLKVHVRNGEIVAIEAGEGHELTSRACARGRAYRQRVYAADRLEYPLKRLGKRGEGKFQRISWDEALDTVAAELKRVKAAYGPAAITFVGSGGDISWLHNADLVRRLLTRFGGYSDTWGLHSCEAAFFASMASYGALATHGTRDNLMASRLIICWGWNPSDTRFYDNTPLQLARAREAGARIICIDPRFSNSAATYADQWIPVIPGTDTAMLLAMAQVILAEGLEDGAFLARHTSGFEKFRDYVLGTADGCPKTPAWAEAITGVPAPTITALARVYAAAKPAALFDGIGVGRAAYGEQFHRAAVALAAMTGNIGVRGGHTPASYSSARTPGISLGTVAAGRMAGGANPVDGTLPPRVLGDWNSRGASSARVHFTDLAEAILEGRPSGHPADYKLLYVTNSNYVNQYANTNKILRALERIEFIVTHEQCMTPTAQYADIVLPSNTYLERNDLCTGGLGLFYGYMNQAVAPIGESRSHLEIVTALAARLGISDLSDKSEQQWLEKAVTDCPDIPDHDTFKREAIVYPEPLQTFVCFEAQIRDPEGHPFATPSGKIEIYSERLARLGDPELPPLPTYIPAWENRDDPLHAKYPLQLVTTHTLRRAHSQFEDVPWLTELYPQAVQINTGDARARGISHGDLVRVFNDRGEMRLPARVTGRIMPGVIEIPQGAWFRPDKSGIDRGGNPNVLTRDRISPGGAFCYNTSLAEVARAPDAATAQN